jgi:hypothetical protein
MGFDFVDRQHQVKKPILLECIDCTKTTDVQTHAVGDEQLALCNSCLINRRTLEAWCYG